MRSTYLRYVQSSYYSHSTHTPGAVNVPTLRPVLLLLPLHTHTRCGQRTYVTSSPPTTPTPHTPGAVNVPTLRPVLLLLPLHTHPVRSTYLRYVQSSYYSHSTHTRCGQRTYITSSLPTTPTPHTHPVRSTYQHYVRSSSYYSHSTHTRCGQRTYITSSPPTIPSPHTPGAVNVPALRTVLLLLFPLHTHPVRSTYLHYVQSSYYSQSTHTRCGQRTSITYGPPPTIPTPHTPGAVNVPTLRPVLLLFPVHTHPVRSTYLHYVQSSYYSQSTHTRCGQRTSITYGPPPTIPTPHTPGAVNVPTLRPVLLLFPLHTHPVRSTYLHYVQSSYYSQSTHTRCGQRTSITYGPPPTIPTPHTPGAVNVPTLRPVLLLFPLHTHPVRSTYLRYVQSYYYSHSTHTRCGQRTYVTSSPTTTPTTPTPHTTHTWCGQRTYITSSPPTTPTPHTPHTWCGQRTYVTSSPPTTPTPHTPGAVHVQSSIRGGTYVTSSPTTTPTPHTPGARPLLTACGGEVVLATSSEIEGFSRLGADVGVTVARLTVSGLHDCKEIHNYRGLHLYIINSMDFIDRFS